MSKIILYLFVIPLVIYAMDSVNFNFVFKKSYKKLHTKYDKENITKI